MSDDLVGCRRRPAIKGTETWKNSAGVHGANSVADVDPLSRGLKPCSEQQRNILLTLVADVDPLSRGLKQRLPICRIADLCCCRRRPAIKGTDCLRFIESDE